MADLPILRLEGKILAVVEKNPAVAATGDTCFRKSSQLSQILQLSYCARLGHVGAASVPRVLFGVSQPCATSKAKAYDADLVDEGIGEIPIGLLAAEREEAKAVLTLFLRKQGLSNAVAARMVNKSELFINHLISKLHAIHKSQYLVGIELTTVEIRSTLIPYLECLREENGNLLVDVVESFPSPPGREKASRPSPTTNIVNDYKKDRAVARASQQNADGLLPTNIQYLVELGMDLEEIKEISRRFPSFPYYSLDRKIKPLVDLLLDLGMAKSDIPTILHKRPQLCGISLSDNLKPMMTFLESFGVDKSQWAKVIYRFPALLTYSRQKVKSSVDFLSELGVSEKQIGKILTRCPHITSYSIDGKLRPTAEYFRSLGINPGTLVCKSPQTFGLSIEGNLRPLTEFFLEIGYSAQEVATMVSRYGSLYTFSLPANVMPKWDFFLSMDCYPRSELVKFPQYFGYSLNERIKPRFCQMKECGVIMVLNQMLSTSDGEFEKIIERKMCRIF
ncbi:hypothetical protein AXF42_Ash000332 [Apostasia shenzhenica]|uniref:Transcription termination factor MTERF5, chloroplastic n=1 Tax=Apostasia shenzhenica TaxID=1088818 RepID=A0A2I0AG46_9ASPA|nr:hypothetical protein AXF42_Ash000332 [Apostasia shenzhenica]